MGELLAAGDLGGAKVASEALAQLLGATTADAGQARPVVDLEAERHRRGRR